MFQTFAVPLKRAPLAEAEVWKSSEEGPGLVVLVGLRGLNKSVGRLWVECPGSRTHSPCCHGFIVTVWPAVSQEITKSHTVPSEDLTESVDVYRPHGDRSVFVLNRISIWGIHRRRSH